MAGDRTEQQRRNFALIYTIILLFVAMGIAIRDFYYSRNNFSDRVYITCNILYLLVVSFKIAVLYNRKIEFFNLVSLTRQHFWHTNYDPQETLILTACKKKCIIFVIIINFCAQGTCAGYMLTPLLANVGKRESERMLPFNMWMNFPTGNSPYFEVLFVIQMLCVYNVAVCYICFDNFLCLVNLHVAYQFRILEYRLTNLHSIVQKQPDDQNLDNDLSSCTILCYAKLRNCVQQHQMLTEYCKKIENVFTMIILCQVLFFGLVLCLLAYQLFLTDAPPVRYVSLMINLSGTLCQVFVFTYSCDGLIRWNAHIGTTIFSGPWSNLPMTKVGKALRRNVVMIIMRSNKYCGLTAGGFFPVCLETYTGILSTAMSYFTLLRQSSVNVE
ncbi:odorant receptor 10-like [Ptiloglossa arizonensis]|uniref:odorant receptor 10-like n=1 Tax=Ptiloglossa arizonensis TaxID=3350558 RepID=UPI003F9FE9FC